LTTSLPFNQSARHFGTVGRNPAETRDLYEGFEWLFNYAYNAPSYKVPMRRMWMGSHHNQM